MGALPILGTGQVRVAVLPVLPVMVVAVVQGSMGGRVVVMGRNAMIVMVVLVLRDKAGHALTARLSLIVGPTESARSKPTASTGGPYILHGTARIFGSSGHAGIFYAVATNDTPAILCAIPTFV